MHHCALTFISADGAWVIQVKGDATVDEVFAEIDKLLESSVSKKTEKVSSA
jgi:hypothetical protein